MYRTDTIIFNSPSYCIRSYGNGDAYLVTRRTDNAECFFQGDDATIFSGALDVAFIHGRNAINSLCAGYDEIMEVIS